LAEDVALSLTGIDDSSLLLDLPWDVPLESWPEAQIVPLPRGISRHVVRFVRVQGRVYAVKEVGRHSAEREYRLLRELEPLDVPCVEAVGVVDGRSGPSGEPLETALVTRHLQFSLPYRALFSQKLRPDTAVRLLDALSLLLVRLHSEGFYWGDCSLSNTLFRRDAGEFAAYLVDAETGELHDGRLTDGQRGHDLHVAHGNLIGELMDLQAGGLLDEDLDPFDTGDRVMARYDALWSELTAPEDVGSGDRRHRIAARVRRLNELGFDVEELTIVHDESGTTVRIQPKVVDAGHHSRRLLHLTGLDAEENQARRLLNDLDAFRMRNAAEDDEQIAAHAWLSTVFAPVVSAVPRELRGKLEPPQVFHEVLDHRWYLSERAGRDVGLEQAVRSYVADILPSKPDEQAVLGARLGRPTVEHPAPPS
jgi:tRNA A-37 threonylcarbamoyl transferase component Bud32